MTKRLLSLIMAICMVFSLIPAVSAEENPVTVTILGKENESYAANVFGLVNEARAEKGLDPYTRNATLSELAMQRAAEIALYFSHTRPDGTDCFTVLDGVYTGWYNCGENIAINQPGPEAVMDSWMNSDGHRENILDTSFTQIGIGCFYADGVYCWVQLFGNSTTDTAETTRTGKTDVMVDVDILPSKLHVETLAVMDLEMRPGETHTIIIDAVNETFVDSSPALIVEKGSATDKNGTIIATWEADSIDGSIVITAVNPGTAVIEIPVYEGQPDPVTMNITVPGEEIPPTEPVETEPVETEPVETEPVETEPVETEPVETEPVETEPVETEPVETEPVPTEPEPTDPSEPDDSIIASGFCGANASWALDSTGTLTISGSGVMTGYAQKGAPWFAYADQIHRLVVEDGITQIGSYAFSHCTELVSAELPDTMYYIDYCAFEYCSSLTGITLPEGIPVIEAGMLRGCTSLVSVVIPDGVTMISDDAFGGCTGLQAVVIPDTVTHIEFNAFMGCPDLTIYCYRMSVAYYYATRNDYAFHLMEDEPDTPTYSISAACSEGGSVIVSPESSPANRYVHISFYPEEGYTLDQVYYLCVSDPELELEFVQEDNFSYKFLMPESDVVFEVHFLSTRSPFTDVKESDYFYEPVLWAVSYDITSGVGNGRFAPGNPCTRAQVVTFLWRAAGEPEPITTRNPFADVKESAYYYKAVLWAVENHITTGMSATTFGPNNSCTRGQVVTFLHRAAGAPGHHFSYIPFRDVSASAFYCDAVLWAVENGITTGMTDTTFAPNSTCTRGQVVTFLYRFLR